MVVGKGFLEMKLLKACLFFLCVSQAYSASALSLQVGSTQLKENWSEQHLDFAGHFWHQWDQMVFFGLGSGVQQYGKDNYYPTLVSTWLRLPIGRTFLPVATGDWGYLIGPDGGFTWKLGGGLDMKLGNDSSILLMSGFQKFYADNWKSQIYIRAGVLLEF